MSTKQKTQIVFTADPKLKEKTLAKAKKEGITLKSLFTFTMNAFVNDELDVGIRQKEGIPTKFFEEYVREAEEELKRGDVVSFDNAQDAVEYLHRFTDED